MHLLRICLVFITILICTITKLDAYPAININNSELFRIIAMQSTKDNGFHVRSTRGNKKLGGADVVARAATTTNTINDVEVQDEKIDSAIMIIRTPQMAGNERGARLHIANGAYPVYYSLARANGHFGDYIRAFSASEYDNLGGRLL